MVVMFYGLEDFFNGTYSATGLWYFDAVYLLVGIGVNLSFGLLAFILGLFLGRALGKVQDTSPNKYRIITWYTELFTCTPIILQLLIFKELLGGHTFWVCFIILILSAAAYMTVIFRSNTDNKIELNEILNNELCNVVKDSALLSLIGMPELLHRCYAVCEVYSEKAHIYIYIMTLSMFFVALKWLRRYENKNLWGK